jgi:CRISPR-associated protein Csb2
VIALRIDFLAGRFHATPWSRGVNDGDIEWPPEPWRILRALVAASFLVENIDHPTFLALLDKLAAPPAFHLPPNGQGHTRHYMPVVEGSVKKSVLILDSFIALERGHEQVGSVFVIYEQALLTEAEHSLLQSLISRIGYLGRAESWCEITLCDDPLPPNVDLASRKEGNGAVVRRLAAGAGLRGAGLFSSIRQTTGEMRKAKRLMPNGTEWIDYRFEALYNQQGLDTPSIHTRSATLGPCILRFALKGAENALLPSLYDTIAVAEAMRSAAMATYSRLHGVPATAMLSGKSPEGSRAIGHTHVFYLPQDTKNLGSIDALDVWLPAGCTHEEYRALSAVTKLYDKSIFGNLTFSLTFLGPSIPSSARVWKTTTPVVLDRFPKRDQSAEDQLRMVLERRKLPMESIDVWESCRYVELRGGRHLRTDAFRKQRAHKSGMLPPMIGVTLRFHTNVCGPLVLGRLAHFGLGQFTPHG